MSALEQILAGAPHGLGYARTCGQWVVADRYGVRAGGHWDQESRQVLARAVAALPAAWDQSGPVLVIGHTLGIASLGDVPGEHASGMEHQLLGLWYPRTGAGWVRAARAARAPAPEGHPITYTRPLSTGTDTGPCTVAHLVADLAARYAALAGELSIVRASARALGGLRAHRERIETLTAALSLAHQRPPGRPVREQLFGA